jgi:hypothetical protein
MVVQTVKPSTEKLKEIANSSHTSIITMLFLALRQRSREASNLDVIKSQLTRMGEKIIDEDYYRFWKSLDSAGVGSYIVGRRGNPNRFKWHFDLKQIAQSAIEGKEQEAKDLAKKKVKNARIVSKPREVAPVTTQRTIYTVKLADGSVAEITLPKEASKKDFEAVFHALTR